MQIVSTMCSGLAQTTLRLGEDLLDQIPASKSISRHRGHDA
jgi:hypothetical protein